MSRLWRGAAGSGEPTARRRWRCRPWSVVIGLVVSCLGCGAEEIRARPPSGAKAAASSRHEGTTARVEVLASFEPETMDIHSGIRCAIPRSYDPQRSKWRPQEEVTEVIVSARGVAENTPWEFAVGMSRRGPWEVPTYDLYPLVGERSFQGRFLVASEEVSHEIVRILRLSVIVEGVLARRQERTLERLVHALERFATIEPPVECEPSPPG